MTVDGVEHPDARIPLVDDRREHHVEVDLRYEAWSCPAPVPGGD
jgi:hypothetical protein